MLEGPYLFSSIYDACRPLINIFKFINDIVCNTQVCRYISVCKSGCFHAGPASFTLLWGEQDLNLKLETRIFPAFYKNTKRFFK